MTIVRDNAIESWDSIVSGKEKYPSELAGRIKRSGDSCREIVDELIPHIVDTALHSMMAAFENEAEIMAIIMRDEGRNIDLAEASDGLMGELYGDEGWISLYSKERPSVKKLPQTRLKDI